ATTCGRGVGVLYQLYLLFRGPGILQLKWRHFRIDLPIIRRLISVGAGGAGQYIIASASWIFLMRIISLFGSEVVAGYTIAIRIVIFTILPSWGLSNAAATLVGQNLGAEQPKRAELSVWRTAFYNMIFLLVMSIIFFFGARFFIGIFTSEPVVMEAGIQCLRILCVGYVAWAYGMVISQSFNGAGDTFTPTLMNFICFWIVQIPLSYLMAVAWGLGPAGVYWSIATSEAVLAVLCVYLFRKGRWKEVKI
ncbi:MAG: MATE family efflux transporter, partial [Phaeodactylibacter sp.]|nr:MATE family efflux transporter [Phaeodactylibacter sp.]